jgi:glycosyltransferase involved in cell wall biosynthesis
MKNLLKKIIHKAIGWYVDPLLDSHWARLNEQRGWIDGHTTRLDEQRGRLDGHGARLDVQQGWIEGHTARLDEQRGRIDGHTARLDEQRGWIDGNTARLDEQRGWLDGHTARLDEQQGWIESHMGYINEHSLRLDKLNTARERLELLVPSIAEDIYTATGTAEIYSGKAPRIIQIVSSLLAYDAIGGEVIAFNNLMLANGYAADIFAQNIDRRLPVGTAKYLELLPKLRPEDILLMRFARGDEVMEVFKNAKCKKILVWHNSTPPKIVDDYSEEWTDYYRDDLDDLNDLNDLDDLDDLEYCYTVSEFNKKCLLDAGVGKKWDIRVIPKYVDLSKYHTPPSERVMGEFSNGGVTNIICVGRVFPNKKIEDVVSCFAEYQKLNHDSRLLIVGKYGDQVYEGSGNPYCETLYRHIVKLGVQNVIFTGQVPFDELIAYYSVADLLLCMSENEGFCVPLVEAMFFGLPIIAYDSTVIGETLGGGGILVSAKNFPAIAALMSEVLSDESRKEELRQKRESRLEYFSQERIESLILDLIGGISAKKGVYSE